MLSERCLIIPFRNQPGGLKAWSRSFLQILGGLRGEDHSRSRVARTNSPHPDERMPHDEADIPTSGPTSRRLPLARGQLVRCNHGLTGLCVGRSNGFPFARSLWSRKTLKKKKHVQDSPWLRGPNFMPGTDQFATLENTLYTVDITVPCRHHNVLKTTS